MPFTLPPLPFDRTALAPHMSAETLDYHHGKHHQAYVNKTNELAAEAGMEAKSLVEVIRAAKAGPLRNNAGQLWNHSFFWQCLTPAATPPSGRLAKLIEAEFDTTEALLEAMEKEAVAHFGSGWIWLLLDGGMLKIKALHDGDTPVAHDGMVPLLTLDLWEHAYYIDYRNARPNYAKTVLSKLINWDFAAQNLDGKGVSRADQG
jgi:Fe-Mn family superoxide dismutase